MASNKPDLFAAISIQLETSRYQNEVILIGICWRVYRTTTICTELHVIGKFLATIITFHFFIGSLETAIQSKLKEETEKMNDKTTKAHHQTIFR